MDVVWVEALQTWTREACVVPHITCTGRQTTPQIPMIWPSGGKNLVNRLAMMMIGMPTIIVMSHHLITSRRTLFTTLMLVKKMTTTIDYGCRHLLHQHQHDHQYLDPDSYHRRHHEVHFNGVSFIIYGFLPVIQEHSSSLGSQKDLYA